uniref:RING-type E3 ubiquitin transferase n=1 Tax=Timema cristinae TaxID=61476 RepID=A0A7R9GV42_TIMCR|nr:unnamed protein product [Timema cristinae]
MWCLVSQPNSVILEVEVDPKAKGQECLEKVCQCLGISKEADYFGLKFHSTKGEELWLNLRNPIERQVTGLPPHRFAIRVKFWVPPHLLLQDTTRHQFYLHARLDLSEGRLKVTDWSLAARLVALVAQAENTDIEPLTALPWCEEPKPADFHQRVAAQHHTIKGMKPSAAEYWLLKDVSSLEDFGQELFHSKTTPGAALGVGPHGVTLYYPGDTNKHSVPYTAINSASSHRRLFNLVYLNLEADKKTFNVKLDTSQAAAGLYRAITEKHAFYSCETVCRAVTTQFIRDLKGTIVSIFNEDTSLGKKYVFDIKRTCREVYDNARRALYQTGNTVFQPQEDDGCVSTVTLCDGCSEENCKQSKQRLSRFLEAMSCRICMDRAIDTALFPCAHIITCGECAARCERCPLCRAQIEQSSRIYLPVELSHLDNS